MRRRVTAVFAAIVAAFLALDVITLAALWPQLRRVEALSTRYAASVRTLTSMRGDVRDLRTAAAQQHLQLRESGALDPALDAELAAARARLEAKAGSYREEARASDEAATWARLTGEAVPEFERAVERATRPPTGGRRVDARPFKTLVAAGSRVDELLQELIETKARQLDVRARELHSTMSAVLLLCVALGVLGSAGGILLVRWALRAVREYERSTGERLAELDEFAGSVAHDLRNPLQAIGMALALVERRATDERTKATCAKATQASVRMGAFIQELLVFARSGAKPAPGASARVDEVLREVQQELAANAEQKNVALLVRAEPELRAAIAPEALRAIVANLADNAVKHMPASGPSGRVELSARNGGPEIQIQVRDTGPGIAPEALPRLFEPFFRATDRPGGFGIGLKTVKRLVDAHRGRIEVASEEGRGSVFTVTLPAADAARGEPAG